MVQRFIMEVINLCSNTDFLTNNLVLDEQETDRVGFDFEVPHVMTCGFNAALMEMGVLPEEFVKIAMNKLSEKYPDGNKDYLQVFHFGELDVWLIANKMLTTPYMEGVHCCTWLLPSEY